MATPGHGRRSKGLSSSKDGARGSPNLPCAPLGSAAGACQPRRLTTGPTNTPVRGRAAGSVAEVEAEAEARGRGTAKGEAGEQRQGSGQG